jgi:predicted ATPase
VGRINELITSIEKGFLDGKYDKFVHDVHFPNFKNFARDAHIEFRFPVTVIVGPNGGGKSSILHAAWGMPNRFSVSRFWFSTPIDPIDPSENPRYWYSHYNKSLGLVVQSRKMYGQKRINYWEPTRPAQKEGMEAMPPKTEANSSFMSSTGDRWTPVTRTPHYFNGKAETSAFDRFFYDVASSTLEARQSYFVKSSRKLKHVIDNDKATLTYYGVERIASNSMLSAKQLKAVNQILQKNYVSARYVSHKLYDKHAFSPSVIFETTSRKYSECFAGSGELSVVNLILALEKLEDYDLLLLDEPETSLHPGAQERLLEHLLTITNEKHLQILISTHSPLFVERLPSSALVVLEDSPDGVVSRRDPTRSSAFSRLGQIDKDRITILTEDVQLKAVVERTIERMEVHLRKKIDVVSVDAGVSEMLSNQVRAHMQSGANVLMVLDGDQKPVEDLYRQDPTDLSPKQQSETISKLKARNVSIIGSEQDLTGWMTWCAKHITLIDEICPEEILLRLLSPDHPLLIDSNATNKKMKDAVRSVLFKQGNDVDSRAQSVILKMKLGNLKAGDKIDTSLSKLQERLERLLRSFE